MSESMSNYADLSRETLATLLPELLLSGHLIDRSGMAHTIGAFGREGMTEVAITEWQLASPVYTRRIQRALGFTGDTVETIFKGLQFDIGAPPQFMDFRYRLHDDRHGEFWLDHCGALADVEPLGTDFVIAMCHDIEDPTFDATALATNPHAQVRPVHRPPREPADRVPVCAWTVTIDPANTPPPVPDGAELLTGSAAARTRLSAIDPGEQGRGDYSGPLLSDIRFADFSRSALIRLADEVCLQHHLLTIAFGIAVRRRTDPDSALDILGKQFAGIAGLTSERLRAALGLGTDIPALVEVLRHHPAFNPLPYTGIRVEADDATVLLRFPRHSGAITDGAWPALIEPGHTNALDAMVRGVNPCFHVHDTAEAADEWTVRVALADEPAREAIEVAIAKVSTGAGFAFTDRGIPLPLTVV